MTLRPAGGSKVTAASVAAVSEAAVATGGTDGEQPARLKLWSLVVQVTDHYVWKNEDTFVGIVADAGEWTVDVDAIREAFAEANSVGYAEVFSAPLYVVKAYVRELRNYGIASEAKEATGDADDSKWKQRDWKELSPELKDDAGGERAQTASTGQSVSIFMRSANMPLFDGSKTNSGKFCAYIELATDAAKRFAPAEDSLKALYQRLVKTTDRVPILTGLTVMEAERAGSQLRRAGFDVESEAEVEDDK